MVERELPQFYVDALRFRPVEDSLIDCDAEQQSTVDSPTGHSRART